ncbi:uroporphyrinogen decarboxylase/cobalamine-independent methonine synthase family protein [Williamsia sterculiae]|uniref:vitamin-B12 independent methionine synthase n=1 Tax=Williamsia sterculiae TaxID=1344003 RepID=UPI000970A73E
MTGGTATALTGGTATGVGSMPGTDARRAAAIVTGELPLAHLPELPQRGLGADMIGRAAALLVDLPMDVAASGYRLTSRPTGLMRTARDHLSRDLDAMEEAWEVAGRHGSREVFKVQSVGPFTLAASVELPGGHKILRDRSAVADVAASLAEGVAAHAAEVARRLGVEVTVQLDEPLVGAVIDGHIRPVSRLDVIDAVPVSDVAETLLATIDTIGADALIHNCDRPRWDLARLMSGVALGVSTEVLRTVDLDGVGAHLDSGAVLALGVVPSTAPVGELPVERVLSSVTELTDRIGLPRRVLADQVIVTPSCGLAGAGDGWVRAALTLCSRAADALAADPTSI